MSLKGAFLARLKASTVSTLVAGRITWGGRPETGKLPAIVLSKVAPGREWTHEGPNPLVNPWVQVDIWGPSDTVTPIAEALQIEMERLDDATAGGWTFKPPAMLVGDQGPAPEDLTGGGQAYRIIHEYRFYAQPAE
jgi:hypothetical protein